MEGAPGGLIANAALILWIPFSLLLFFTTKPDRAAFLTIFGGLLFLPELAEFKLPLLPAFTKQTIPYFCVLLGFTLRRPNRVWRLPRERWVLVITLVVILGGIGMYLTNGDGLSYGVWRKIFIPGLGFKDGMFVVVSNLFYICIPFFLGTVMVKETRDIEELLRYVVKFALVYAFFALVEIRMSPQMHRWVYGYAQHSFGQTIRFGGYRPMLFMAHGLAVGLFFCVSLLAAVTLAQVRTRGIFKMKIKTIAWTLAVILIVCKSTGAIVYATVGTLLLLFTSTKIQGRVMTTLAVIVLLYPSMRGAGLFPTEQILELAGNLGEDRVGSVAFRFNNEEILLKKARERPVFGWGSYGRNLIYDGGGRNASVTDGEWIIALGMSGFVGFYAKFGMLIFPVIIAAWRIRRARPHPMDANLVAGLAMIVAMAALDLLPNGLFSNYPYFLSGALLTGSGTFAASQQTREELERELEQDAQGAG